MMTAESIVLLLINKVDKVWDEEKQEDVFKTSSETRKSKRMYSCAWMRFLLTYVPERTHAHTHVLSRTLPTRASAAGPHTNIAEQAAMHGKHERLRQKTTLSK